MLENKADESTRTSNVEFLFYIQQMPVMKSNREKSYSIDSKWSDQKELWEEDNNASEQDDDSQYSLYESMKSEKF